MKPVDNKLRSFRIKGRLPQWAYWVIGAGIFAIGWLAVGKWARLIALRDLKATPDQWTSDGILVEGTDYTCVPASIVMLLRDEGINTTTYDVAVVAGTDIFGTDEKGVVNAGKRYGFKVRREVMTFDQFIEAGLPAILEFRYKGDKHAAYVSPMGDIDAMQVKDPVDGLLFLDKFASAQHFGRSRWEVFLFERER